MRRQGTRRHKSPETLMNPLQRAGAALACICATSPSLTQADTVWRVDRLGLIGPEHTNAGGGQNSHTREGSVYGQVRFSIDPLAYIIGESGKTVNGNYREDAWIYDVRRREHINVTQALRELVPGTEHANISYINPAGIAVGTVNIPNDVYGPGVLTHVWRYENRQFALV